MNRKLFAKLNFNIEEFPKPNYKKGKKGVYGEIDIVINIDDPYVFKNGNKQYASISLPQTQEDRQNKIPRTYLNGWVLDINSVGSGNGEDYKRDEEWYNNNKQDTVPDTVSSTDDKGDLPF